MSHTQYKAPYNVLFTLR